MQKLIKTILNKRSSDCILYKYLYIEEVLSKLEKNVKNFS